MNEKATKRTPTDRSRRVLIVDDHPIVRHGMGQLLDDEPDLNVCAEAANAGEAVRAVEEFHPDMAIIDIQLDGMDGLNLLKDLKARWPELHVLIVSVHDETLYAERALRAGALGYLNKQTATDFLVEACRRVLAGEIYLSEQMSNRLLHSVVGGKTDLEESPIDRLSDRELEVYRLLGEGLGTRQIADKLALSMKTIETYRENIKEKLNLADSNQLVRHAVQWVLEQA
ncbi:MAG: response regulator transcription factor [Planctomycetota bacterium]|nr:response regulator transcription factor [Planctomycetota bacterium]